VEGTRPRCGKVVRAATETRKRRAIGRKQGDMRNGSRTAGRATMRVRAPGDEVKGRAG